MNPFIQSWRPRRARVAWLCVALLAGAWSLAQPASARINLLDGSPVVDPRSGGVAPEAIPDIFGPGAVLNVGNIQMKVTNYAIIGNPFIAVSSDPSCQWPGTSGVEYLNAIALAVGAVNPRATDPAAVRRVSYFNEWRPQTLDPEDRMYRAYDGIINGTRFANDDHDVDPNSNLEPPFNQRLDEDFLDGHDNDGDGLIDEDYAALGQQMYSCVMWDNTIQALNTTSNEKHVPLGLECRQKAWAYSIGGFQNFNVIEYQIFNRSGHVLDSLVVGWLVDMDCGPTEQSSYWQDDLDGPQYPFGEFTIRVGSSTEDLPDPKRAQIPHDPSLDGQFPPDSALCPRVNLRVNGFSLFDDNGDDGKTPGIVSFLLINHTTDPTGTSGPSRVGFKAFRSYTAGTPYQQGGGPTIDQQRFEFMVGAQENGRIDPETGFISRELSPPGDTRGDFVEWASVGPWRNVPDGGSITVTIAMAIQAEDRSHVRGYINDYLRYAAQRGDPNADLTAADLLARYPVLANAFAAQVAYEGVHDRNDLIPSPDFHGRESGIILPRGTTPQQITEDCEGRNPRTTTVTDREFSWFDFDCNYCTGIWDYLQGSGNPQAGGLYHKTWNTSAPPPNPNLNAAASYNFSDNPDRKVTPAGDGEVNLAWDNISETTPDPKTGWFDFRGYRVWKVSDWTRPVGASGPAEGDWKLLGEFRLFDHLARNYSVDSVGVKHCPEVYVPNYSYLDTDGQPKQGKLIPICLDRGDLWDKQSGEIIKPDTTVDCIRDLLTGECQVADGCRLVSDCGSPSNQIQKIKYPIGRYKYLDREVKNGFIYFYSVTAFDSVTDQSSTTEFSGRRSAVEAEAVAPQVSTATGKSVWVVPNPYRGYSRISDRPSAWDLTPNATDPTGTHIDFMGLPTGEWTIRIYTVSGDLVAEIHSADAVNESIRPPVLSGSQEYPGYNRQQDNPNDGQARWNLISRNGQDIVSGIYLFTVESKEGTQRGRFVVIR